MRKTKPLLVILGECAELAEKLQRHFGPDAAVKSGHVITQEGSPLVVILTGKLSRETAECLKHYSSGDECPRMITLEPSPKMIFIETFPGLTVESVEGEEDLLFILREMICLHSLEGGCYHFQHEMPAEIGFLKRLKLFLFQAGKLLGLSGQQVFQSRLLMEEILINAMNYAYPNGKGKLGVDLRLSRNYFFLEVRDTGVGFNPDEIRDISEWRQEDFYSIRGRGIFLVRSISSELTILSRPGEGTLVRVKLVFPEKDAD
ncbi:MAG: ATP-binding protein [Candidatus Wallbacteria bacterium]|nr:ATP-binding protein [Candidatus Wallbacteria bacterium]